MEVCCAECKECIQHATFRGESLLFYAFSLAEGFCFGFGFDFFFLIVLKYLLLVNLRFLHDFQIFSPIFPF